MNPFKTRWRQGAAAVEFAFVVPLIFMVLVGVVDISIYISELHVISRAGRDGARVGAAVIEGATPTGDMIEASAIAHTTAVLAAAGFPCGTGCSVTANWAYDGGWAFVTVDIRYPHQRYFTYLPSLSEEITTRFSMLTQQQ